MYSSRVALTLAACLGAASAFSPAPLGAAPSLRAAPATSLCMKEEGVSRKSFLSLGFGLLSAAALPPTQAKADAELTPEEMAEYKKLLKQAFKIEGLIENYVDQTQKSLGSDDGEPETPEKEEPYDPWMDQPQTMFSVKDMKEGKGKVIKLGN